MQKKWKRTLLCLTAATLAASLAAGCTQSNGDKYEDYNADKQPGDDAFDFDGNYVSPELTIDGKGTEQAWADASVLASFGVGGNAATVKAYRGTSALFFLFEVKDSVLLTEGNANDDSVTRSDSIEFYLDTLADGGSKPQNDDYQINLGIHGKTRIMQGSGSGWGNWNGLIDYEVSLDGTLNDGTDPTDGGYSVEVMIPYAQINIEKDDTIAVSFGQVDKFGAGNQVETDWTWNGWTYGGKLVEPQTPDNYILLDKDNQLMTRDEQAKPAADMAGYVYLDGTQTPVAGATVTFMINGENVVRMTDDQGYFILEDVDSNMSYTGTVVKDGYLTATVQYTREELRASDGGRVVKNVSLISESEVQRTVIAGTVKNVVDGIIAGATVKVEGYDLSAQTDSDGTFSISEVPVLDEIVLVVTKEGYGETKTYLGADELIAGDITQLGDVNLNLPWGETGTFGLKSAMFANSSMQIARGLDGIEFRLSGTRQLSGKIELYFDTKDSTGNRDTDDTCWRFDLSGTGSAEVYSYETGGLIPAEGLTYRLFYNGSDGYEAYFFLPYEFVGMRATEVFGISLGQWSDTAKDWDGWGYNGAFIKPESPTEYVRVNMTNQLYRQNNNDMMVDISGNAGMAGVTVDVGGKQTTTGENGAWSMKIAYTAEEVTISYSKLGYVTQTEKISAGYFDTKLSFVASDVDLQEHKVTVSGVVTDTDTSDPIEGVKVTLTIGDAVKETTTDAQGKYTFSDVTAFENVTVGFAADGYVAGQETLTVAQLTEGTALTLNRSLTSLNQVKYVTAVGTVTNVNGAVAGATVSVSGEEDVSALTQADGSFTLENFAVRDCTVLIEKDGYLVREIAVRADNIGDVEEYQLGAFDLPLEYAQLGGTIAAKNDDFANFSGKVTRSAEGFEFVFTGTRAFFGHLELFVDTKTSAGDNGRNATDYRFDFNDDGSVGIDNWGGPNTTVPAGINYKLTDKDTAPVLTFTIPYSFLGVEPTEIIGISVGQWSTAANGGAGDWDGWTVEDKFGANNEAFVKPEMPSDYLRIGADNAIFANAANVSLEEADLNSYNVFFAKKFDHFLAKVSRDAEGVTFDFVTQGDFSKNGEENEMVLIYLDLGATVSGGWETVDVLVKIASDGNVYRKAGAWWSATDADKIGTVTITREGGFTRFSLTMSYTDLGIAADEVFGFAMREASHNSGDHSLYGDPNDCSLYIQNVDDTANAATYIRVGADGTLYKASSNATAEG